MGAGGKAHHFTQRTGNLAKCIFDRRNITSQHYGTGKTIKKTDLYSA